MRLITHPKDLAYPPRACVKTGRIDGTIIDLQTVIDSPMPTRLYLKAEVIEEAAKLLEMVPAEEIEEMKASLEAMAEEISELRETASLTTQLEEKLAPERTIA